MSDLSHIPTPRTKLIMDNVGVAISADNREQSIAHKEEAEREIEQLERELSEALREREALREALKPFAELPVEQFLQHQKHPDSPVIALNGVAITANQVTAARTILTAWKDQ